MPQQALIWSSRQQLLLDEIFRPQADIVCLQEVNKYGQKQKCPLKERVAVQSCVLNSKLLNRLFLQRTFSYLCWKNVDTVAHTSASPVRQLSSMVHLVMVVRFSTVPNVLLFARSLKVRRSLLAAVLAWSSWLFYLVWYHFNCEVVTMPCQGGTRYGCIVCNDLLRRPYVHQLAC